MIYVNSTNVYVEISVSEVHALNMSLKYNSVIL